MLRSLALGTIWMLFADSVSAGTVTFSFTGVIDQVTGVPPGFSVAQAFSGTYSFDPDTQPVCSPTLDSTVCSYFHANPPFGARLTLQGGGVIETSPGSAAFRIFVEDALAAPGSDGYGLRSEQSQTSISGISLSGFVWELAGGPGVFSGTSLPVVPPDPNQFQLNRLVIG